MGDYNNIGSTGTSRFVTWGYKWNVVRTNEGAENQHDVFLQSHLVRADGEGRFRAALIGAIRPSLA